MQHAGSDHNVWLEAPLMEKLQALKEAANARNSLERVRDVNFVIDQLERWNVEPSHPLHGKLDLEHIGMAGHSFGAVTTLSVAGQKYPLGKQFTEKRIDAFLAMSPQTGESGLMARRVFEEIATPVLCMTGTRDDSPIDKRVTPATRREVFAGLPPGNKYELVFDGGHHFTFGDTSGFRTRSRDADHHPAIERISTEFWNAYLRDDLQAKQWLQSELPRDACKLKSKDVWQWK
jgi:predicted dienelactone hydrolase